MYDHLRQVRQHQVQPQKLKLRQMVQPKSNNQPMYKLADLAVNQMNVNFDKQLVVRHSCQTTP
jgi:hypothetical protein